MAAGKSSQGQNGRCKHCYTFQQLTQLTRSSTATGAANRTCAPSCTSTRPIRRLRSNSSPAAFPARSQDIGKSLQRRMPEPRRTARAWTGNRQTTKAASSAARAPTFPSAREDSATPCWMRKKTRELRPIRASPWKSSKRRLRKAEVSDLLSLRQRPPELTPKCRRDPDNSSWFHSRTRLWASGGRSELGLDRGRRGRSRDQADLPTHAGAHQRCWPR